MLKKLIKNIKNILWTKEPPKGDVFLKVKAERIFENEPHFVLNMKDGSQILCKNFAMADNKAANMKIVVGNNGKVYVTFRDESETNGLDSGEVTL